MWALLAPWTVQPFPHHYTVKLENRRLVSPTQAPIELGPPPQFGGSDTVWSPEELLVGAVLECLWTTFESFARRDKLAVTRWSGIGRATLDRGPGAPVFTAIELDLDLVVAEADRDLAGQVLDKAKRHCIISNALNVPVVVHATIAPAELAA